MQIHHIALWTTNLEKQKDFYLRYFQCAASAKYENQKKEFASYFLHFANGTALELMHKSNCNIPSQNGTRGWAHIAISLGSKHAVDALTTQLALDNYHIISQPRTTGDGYYESLVLDPEGNEIELTATHSFVITQATEHDLENLLYLQKCCYLQEAELYNNYTIAPITQTINDVKNDFAQKVILKIEQSGRIIGSIRGHQQNDTCYVGKLMVDRYHQNKGFGTKLLLAIEKFFSSATRFELFTGIDSAKNLYLYKKNGYSVFKEDSSMDSVTMVFLEKLLSDRNIKSL